MPGWMVVVLIFLTIIGWFLLGEETTVSEKVKALLIILGIYVTFNVINGVSLKEALLDPVARFFGR